MVALNRMLPPQESEEVVQETYLKLYLNYPDTPPDNPTAYVYRVSRNLAISRLRSQKLASQYAQQWQTDGLAEQDEPQQRLHEEQEKALLLEAINHLPPICRQVFVLRKLQDKSHREIADELGISPKTVENHIHKGMQLCQQYLSDASHFATLESAKKRA